MTQIVSKRKILVENQVHEVMGGKLWISSTSQLGEHPDFGLNAEEDFLWR